MKTRSLLPLRLCIPFGLLAFLALSPAQTPPKKEEPKKDEPKEVKKDEKPAQPAEPGKGPVIPPVDLSSPGELATQSDIDFAKGDWLNAAAKYNGLVQIGIKTGMDAKALEPLYFVIGVCMYNLPNYDEAYKRFTEYTQKFPTGPNVHQVNLAIARIFRAQKKWPEAVKQYKPLINVPSVKEEALIELADSHKENQEKDKAIIVLETALAAGMKTASDVRAALYLVDLYQEDKPEKGVALLEKIKTTPGSRAVISEINFAALKLADGLMQADKPDQALAAFQNLRKQKEVVDTLKILDADYTRGIAALAPLTAPRMPNASANLQQMDRMKFFQAQAKAMIASLEKEKNYDAVLFYRMGRCFAALERFWEARLAFKYVLDNFPTFEDIPAVHYALTFCYYSLAPQNPDEDNLGISKEAQRLCREYLTKYKDKSESSQVAEMLVTLASRTKNPEQINQVYEEVMDLIKDSPNRTVFLAQQVQNYLGQYDFDKARDAADKFLAAAPPDDPMREAVEYMRGLTWFFKNDYKGAMEQLKGYIAKYPAGAYIHDAKYRLAFLVKGEQMAKKAKKMEGVPSFMLVIRACEDIIQNHANTDSVANAYALIGDSYKEMTGAELEKEKLTVEQVDINAANAYVDAVKQAKSDSVAEYSLTQAAPLLKAQGRWEEVRLIYENFRKAWPDHRITLTAVGEICKAIVRTSDSVNAKELAEAEKAKLTANDVEKVKLDAKIKELNEGRQKAKEEAQAKSREYLASTIMDNINNPQKEGVEELMQQLAITAIPKPKPRPAAVPAPAPATPGATTVAATPAAPPKRPDPPSVAEQGKAAEAELDRLLAAGGKLTTIGQARLVYVKSQLYKYLESRAPRKKDAKGKYVEDTSPKRSDELMKQVLTEFKVDDYSSAMLAAIGDKYMKDGDLEGAANCFNRLLLLFPKSLFLDWAAVGLGDIAMAAKEPDYATALKKYTLATDEYPGSKYGEAVMGKARVQYATDKLEEAEKALKDVIGDKSYPLESKAEATYLRAEIRAKQKAMGDAYMDFQKLYLSFKKFPNWACKGYLRAGEIKEALGKFEDAKKVYSEAINDPKNAEKFKGLPDFDKIKANYQKLG
ncbi:MAG TPA: tetratricopeptide repeat protein [Verrucomicrobiales bacterium]|nr:tetratricopeptide repeat protein [Verrucomicrobiales bacterium]